MFRNSLAFMRWSLWAHAGLDLALCLGVATLVGVFCCSRPAQVAGSLARLRFVPRLLAVLSVGAALVSVLVAAQPPTLAVSKRALTRSIIQDLVSMSGLSVHSVAAPRWAQVATKAILRHYASYTEGRFFPRIPPRYHLLLLLVKPRAILQVVPSFQTSGLPALSTQTVDVTLAGMPANTVVSLTRARRVAVGLVTGITVTDFQRSKRLLLAVYTRGPMRSPPGSVPSPLAPGMPSHGPGH